MPVTFTHAATNGEFIAESVAWIKTHIENAIAEHGSCIIGLSGGSTPQPIYEALGKEDIDWSKVHLFQLDERYISADDKDSNQKMIRDTLLKNADIPESNIVFPNTSLPLQECIDEYAMRLQVQWSEYLPDINILGMGDDGHISSLFPPLSDDVMGDEGLVFHTTTDRFAVHDRITISLNAVSAAGAHLFLLKGEAKKKVWDEMMKSEEGPRRWPAKAFIEMGDVTVMWTE